MKNHFSVPPERVLFSLTLLASFAERIAWNSPSRPVQVSLIYAPLF